MSIAQSILDTPDRTLKERRNMAELRDIGPEMHGGKVDWKGDCSVCYFRDGSALMMVLDDDLCPSEFLVIAPPGHDEAAAYAAESLVACEASGVAYDCDTLSHNIESNFPDLDLSECDLIADQAIRMHATSASPVFLR